MAKKVIPCDNCVHVTLGRSKSGELTVKCKHPAGFAKCKAAFFTHYERRE